MSELVAAPRGWLQAAGAVVVDVLRSVGALPPSDFKVGGDWIPGQPATAAYDPLKAMSTVAAFAWVRACAQAIAEDLSGLPIEAEGAKPGAKPHPAVELIKAMGLTARRQLVLDLVLTGYAYVLVEGVGRSASGRALGKPTRIRRLHPARTKPVPDAAGDPVAYKYEGGGVCTTYAAFEVLHIQDTSWEDGAGSMFGTSPIMALHHDLVADLEASKASARAASSGRPAALISPKDAQAALAPTQVKDLGERVRSAYKENNGGVVVWGQALEHQVLSWTPKDMEMPAQRAFTREAILAVFGVPPTRVGLPMANYATAIQQDRVYWTTLQARAALIDEAWTRLGELCGLAPVPIGHNFRSVPALQADRTERLGRVVTMVTLLGADPAEAAAWEGMPDLPVGEVYRPEPAPAEPPPPKDPPPADAPAEDDGEDDQAPSKATTAEQRAGIWRSWLGDLHGPTELALARTLIAYHAGRRLRTAERARNILREAGDEDLIRLIIADDQERKLLERTIGPRISQAVKEAFGLTLRRLGVLVEWRAGKDGVITADLVSRVSDTTRDAIAEVLQRGLRDGETTEDLVARLNAMGEWAPSRSLTIARTESTRSLNAGSEQAQQAAAASGVPSRRQWVSARDEHVRDAHQDLDGQVVELGEKFTVDGHSAAYPGDFHVPELDINCRCTVIPVAPKKEPR